MRNDFPFASLISVCGKTQTGRETPARTGEAGADFVPLENAFNLDRQLALKPLSLTSNLIEIGVFTNPLGDGFLQVPPG